MFPKLSPYLAIGSCLNSIITRWYASEKSMIDLQKINNAPYQNSEQELKKAVNQKIQNTQDKWFYLSYVLYL